MDKQNVVYTFNGILLIKMKQGLSKKAQSKVFFELIFMTYSYVHNAINHEAFPNAINLFNKEI